MQEQNNDLSPENQEVSQILNSILSTTRDGYWRVDESGYLVDVNQKYCDLSGYSCNELIGMQIKDLEAAEDEEEVARHIALIIKNGNDIFETRHRRKDGSEWNAEASVTFKNGHFCVFVRDITDRKRLEIEREQYYNFFLTSSDIVVFADPNGAFLKINPYTTRILGYTEDELISKPFVDFIHPGDKQSTIDEMIRQQEIGSSLNFVNRYVCKDGSHKWLSWNAIYDDHSKMTYAIARDITELKAAEVALARSLKLHGELERLAKVGGWEFSISTGKQIWTEETYRIHELDLSYGPNVERGVNFYAPASKPLIEAAVRDVIENGKPFDLELELITKKSNTRSVHVIGLPDIENDRVYGYIQDITERKRAEEALRENEETFKSVLETSSDAILLQDSTAAFIDCNQAALDLLKMTREQFINMTPDQISVEFQPNGRRSEEYAPEMTELGRKGYHRFEWTCRNLEGGEFIVEVTLVAFRRRGEEMLHCTWRNITDRILNEKKLKESEELLNIAGSIAHIGGWKLDIKEQALVWSKEVFAIHEVDEKYTPTVSSAIDFYDKESKPIIQAAVKEAIEKGKSFDVELGIVTDKGNHRDVRAKGSAEKDDAGKINEVYGVFQDITERKQLEAERARFEQQSNQIQKLESLGVLAGGIAHDFNNLLAGIFGYIELAKTSTSDQSIVSYLEESTRSIDRARSLTQQLLTFSKGGAPLIRIVDLGPIAEANATFALSGSDVSFDMDIDPSLWQVRVDENQIGQVIGNLVINAMQAMHHGGNIHITARNTEVAENERMNLEAGKYVKLSISDTGTGIPHELLKKIFDPFFTTKQQGQGLGLATCYSIIKKHGGAIEVESVVGSGSTFHVFLPAGIQVVDLKSSKAANTLHKGTGKVLIMDDEPSIREVLGLFLKKMGYSIVEVSRGEEALSIGLEALRQGEPITAAFFDLTIPGGMGGKETINQFRDIYPDIPVYVSSGYSEDPIMSDPAKYGFTDSIAKPFRMDDISQLFEQNAKK